jgi:hypothetical protein
MQMTHQPGLEGKNDIGGDDEGHNGKDHAQHIARKHARHQPADEGSRHDEGRPEPQYRKIERAALVMRPGAHDAGGNDDGQ